MKLRNLNGAVRKVHGPVIVSVPVPGGLTLQVGMVKSSLLDGLKATYGEDTTVETGLTVTEEGHLVPDGALPAAPVETQIDGRGIVFQSATVLVDDDTIDIEDLLGDPAPTCIVNEVEDLLA